MLITNQQFSRNSISQWKNLWEVNKGKSRVQWFIDDLYSADFQAEKDAAIYLGEMGNGKAVPALSAKLNDPQIDSKLKIYVTEALKKLLKNKR